MAYQLVAQLGFEGDWWVAPLDARRLRPRQDTDEVGAEKVRTLWCNGYPSRKLFPSSSLTLATILSNSSVLWKGDPLP